MPKKSDYGKDNKNRNKKSETEHQIEISKRLLAKRKCALKTPPSIRDNNASQTLENAKPMPTLAELEKMLEDPDNENTNPTENEFVTPSKKSIDNSKDKLLISPEIVQTNALRLIDKITKISNPSELLGELPPRGGRPIMRPKMRKKPEQHYIVGCKDRSIVTWKPTTKFRKGGDDYGVDRSTSIDDEIPKKRAKMLKDIPGELNDSSDARTETVAYGYKDCYPQNIRPPSFSPIPSTSRENKTIIKNDQLLNRSYACNKINHKTNSVNPENLNDMEHANKDVEIVEAPIETIVLDDTYLENKFPQPILKRYCDNSARSVNGNSPKNNQIEVLANYPGNFLPYGNNGVLIDLDNSRISNTACNKRNRKSDNKPEQRNIRYFQNKSLCVKTVPTRPINSTPAHEQFGECPICMDNMKGKMIASTLCGHIFCMECITASIKSSGKWCPVCRKKLKGVGFHPIFL